jgi:Periplasmic component of the Tol biopolymer transport system
MKLRNGSLKDYVPNHYPLGYLMVNYGREKYGLDFWTKVTRDAAAYRGLFYPFQGAIKRYSGVDYKTFRKDALDYYEKLNGVAGDKSLPAGQAGIAPKGLSEGALADLRIQHHGIYQDTAAGIHSITPINTKYVTNYLFPYQLGGDSVLYLKTTYRHRPAFYIKDNVREHRLRTKDIAIEDQYSYRNGKIVYSAFEPDARWGWKDFSVIKIFDVYSHQQRTLSHRTKYFTPDISPDGNKVAAVEVVPGGKSQLLILDANSGKIIQQFHSIEIGLFTDPKFIDDTSLVTAVRLADGKMALAIADITVGSLERLTTPSYGVLGYPTVKNGIVYFTASFSGNDELYAFRLNDKKVFRITQTSLGNYFVNASDQKLVWSSFTAEGYRLQGMNSDTSNWTEVSEMEITVLTNPFPIAHSDSLHDILSSEVPNRSFDVSKYKQAGHLFRFHSWRPYYADPDFTYSIYSDNILNTMSTELFYHYNQDDKTNGVGVNLLYGAFYPYINGGMEYTFDLPVVINNKAAYINRLETKIGLSLPLDFTSDRTFKNLVVGTDYVYNQQIFKGFTRIQSAIKF